MKLWDWNSVDCIPEEKVLMCRILAIKSTDPFDPKPHLREFAEIAETSKEFQGHGWGLTSFNDGKWHSYHNIKPVWEDDLSKFGDVNHLLVHARSAFEDEGISVENNMPFNTKDKAFIFNGELRGVKLNANGRIGAEKIFNFILRMNKGQIVATLNRAIPIIDRRTEYIRALNFVISDGYEFYVSNFYNEDPDYFNLHLGRNEDKVIISSVPYETDVKWEQLDNYTVEVF